MNLPHRSGSDMGPGASKIAVSMITVLSKLGNRWPGNINYSLARDSL